MKLTSFLLVSLALLTAACQTESQREAERRRAEEDSHSAAFKAGEAAQRAASEAARAAAAAGRKLDEGARKAEEGWKEQERKDHDRR